MITNKIHHVWVCTSDKDLQPRGVCALTDVIRSCVAQLPRK